MREKSKGNLLIGTIKRKSDLKILSEMLTYRAPCRFVNPTNIKYIAFYLPGRIFSNGKRIELYGAVKSYSIMKRRCLSNYALSEADKDEMYVEFKMKKLYKMKNPIINNSHMRISFKVTDQRLLKSSRSMCALYKVNPLEDMLSEEMTLRRIKHIREHTVLANRKKYRLDFAVFCKRGILCIECDSKKWHSRKAQAERDIVRDNDLKKENIKVLHISEEMFLCRKESAVKAIEENIEILGGVI